MSRVAAVLLLFVLAASVPAQEDPRLVGAALEKLDDDRIEVRAAAATALSKLGKSALPSLRRALADAGPERRDRLAEIIRKIEERERLSALLPPPSLITIEAKDRPLHEVLQALIKQSRTPI
ncbi:MAG: hypothetical protein JO332_13440, partial [Planctomycetaceae bacterium]|nr:hypothetical protein [Planctomycetaceae bacterium]